MIWQTLPSLQKVRLAAVVVLCWWMSAFVAAALTPSNIVDQVARLSYENFHTNLFVHTNENRGFTTASPRVPANQHDLARDFILSSFTNMGLSVTLDPFATAPYTNANNVVAIKPGLNASNFGYYVVGAHYDSVPSTSSTATNRPGADDNASGVAGVLEVARVLSPYTFKATLIFIAFDNEEAGMNGSYHYVADSTSSTPGDPVKIYRGDIRGMVSMDMIAFNPAGVNSNKAQIYGGNSDAAKPVRTNLANALTQYGGLSFDNSGANNSSDHGPFYYGGMDACLLIEYNHGPNPYYHQIADSVDTPGYIDYEFATKMTKGVAGYLCSQAGLVPPASASAPQLSPDGTNLVMNWDSMAGLVQQVEYRDSLTGAGEWSVLGTYTNVDGAWALAVTDQVESVSRRYYRVQSW
jgi:hypothetical protein